MKQSGTAAMLVVGKEKEDGYAEDEREFGGEIIENVIEDPCQCDR